MGFRPVGRAYKAVANEGGHNDGNPGGFRDVEVV